MGKGNGGRTELRKMGKRKSMKNEGRGLVFTVKLPVHSDHKTTEPTAKKHNVNRDIYQRETICTLTTYRLIKITSPVVWSESMQINFKRSQQNR